MKQQWEFEGRKIVVTDIKEKCCFICGSKDHSQSLCPKKIIKRMFHLSKQKPTIIFEGNTWAELSESITQRKTRNFHDNSNNNPITAVEIKNRKIDELIKEHEELKERMKHLEEENSKMNELITNFQIELKGNMNASHRAVETTLEGHDTKIDHILVVLTDLSRSMNMLISKPDSD